MKLPAAHLERIQQLGYTDSEARFLYIVFSGYFTMRQFRAFTGSRCGKRPSGLRKSSLSKGTLYDVFYMPVSGGESPGLRTENLSTRQWVRAKRTSCC